MSTYVLLSRSTAYFITIFVHNFLFKSFKLVSVFVLLLTTCKFITLSLTDWHRGTVSHFALSSWNWILSTWCFVKGHVSTARKQRHSGHMYEYTFVILIVSAMVSVERRTWLEAEMNRLQSNIFPSVNSLWVVPVTPLDVKCGHPTLRTKLENEMM